MYAFIITQPTNFVATTVTGLGGSANFDTQLFLFNANGFGIAANDDSSSSVQSTINNSTGLYTSLAAGLYYLAISSYDTIQ
ncbi:MAG TPA: DVUA0089 family protein [Gemmatales bacterium]|nr:DVUA0089 family protein [Gemmatales bacterium]HMP17827.1 DVUA0089 family protein [Gemmatales bacterium]